jgi:hypothetical protein
MKLEYFEDAHGPSTRVLLLFGASAAEVGAVRAAIAELASSDGAPEFRFDHLPGFVGVAGCSLVARIGASDLGVAPTGPAPFSFQCVLTRESWRSIAGLLDPFLADVQHDGFQHLTDVGAIAWIISTSRAW